MPETTAPPLETRFLDAFDAGTWSPVAGAHPFPPYYFEETFPPEPRRRLLLSRLEAAAGREGAMAVGAFRHGEPCGIAVATRLPWETRFFGFDCRRLDALLARGDETQRTAIHRALLRALLPRLAAAGTRSLYAKVDTKDFAAKWALDAQGFLLSEVTIFWTGRFEHFGPPPPPIGTIRDLDAGDLPVLRKASRQAMEWNRFLADRHFPRGKVHEMYERIVDACGDGLLADHVLVLEHEGRPRGLVALEYVKDAEGILPVRVGNFRYVARAPQSPPGTGPNLIEAGCRWWKGKVGLMEAQTTMQNTGMIRTAVRKGFRIQATNADFYKWFGPGER